MNFVDPEGKAFLPNLLGGVASLGLEYAGQVIQNVIEDGLSIDNFIEVDISDLTLAFVEGAITCGTNLIKKAGTKVAVGIMGEVVRNTVDFNVKDGELQTPKVNPVEEVAVNTTIGLAVGSVKTEANVKLFKGQSANSARVEAGSAARAKGQKFTAKDSNNAANKARKLNAEKKTANSVISDAVNSIGTSVGSDALEGALWKYEENHRKDF